MQRKVQAEISLRAGQRFCLWGHNFHLARDDDAMDTHYGAGPGGDSEHSLGHCLNAWYPGEVYTVWMVFGGGEDAQPFPELPTRFDYPDDSWNGIFRRVGGNFFLPLAGLPVSTGRLPLYHMYNTFNACNLAEQADAIVYIDQVSPLGAP